MDDFGPGGRVAFGVVFGLASTSIQSLGLTLQRKSHILEDEKSIDEVPRPPYRRRRWQLGMAMFIIANIVGSTIQITTLPLPVLSTLQASGLVFNSICATLILHEPFTRYSVAGTVLVSGGAALIAIFGAVGEPAHGLSKLLELFERAQFIVWIIGTAILIALALVATHILKTKASSPKTRLLRGMAYGFVSGILSAHSLLLAKSAVELVVRTVSDHINQFDRWQSFAILLGLVALAGSQLYYLHKGLKLCSTSILYPFVFCIYNIIAILDGLIYFDQTSRITISHGLLVLLGTVILLVGVVCLSWRLNDAGPDPGPLMLETDLAYLDSDASSLSSTALDSPPPTNESTSLLPKPPVFSPSTTPPAFPPRREQTLPPDLETGTYGTTSPPGPRRTVHWDPGSSTLQPPSASSLHRTGTDVASRRSFRRQAYLEADALWDELQEAPDRVPPLAGDSSSSLFQPRTRSRSLAYQAQQRGTPSPPPGSPGGTSFSPGPLARSSTGRSYRERRPRRTSAFGGYFPPTPEHGEERGDAQEGRDRSETPRARMARRATESGSRLRRVWRALSDAGRTITDAGRSVADAGRSLAAGSPSAAPGGAASAAVPPAAASSASSRTDRGDTAPATNGNGPSNGRKGKARAALRGQEPDEPEDETDPLLPPRRRGREEEERGRAEDRGRARKGSKDDDDNDTPLR